MEYLNRAMNADYIGQFTSTLNQKIEPHVQTHLKNVYSTVAMGTLAASAGAYLHLYTDLGLTLGSFTNFILSLGCMFMLATTPHDSKTETKRMGFLLGLAFLMGASLGPWIEVTLFINPNIFATALSGTFIIFGCFTLATIFSDRRKALYYSTAVLSFCSLFFFMAILNLFFQIDYVHQTYLYSALASMCAFVVFDTVKIIELRLAGDTDYIAHAGILFLDMIRIFRLLLVLLTEKDKRNKRNKRKD